MSGMGGSILSSLFIRNDISVGASGALFGLLGSMLSELLTNWTIYSNKVYLSIIRALYKLILLDPLGIVRPFFLFLLCVVDKLDCGILDALVCHCDKPGHWESTLR